VCLFTRREQAVWRTKAATSSHSTTEMMQKSALSMNQFRTRVRLHTGWKRTRFRARILVNAGYGYRTVKNAASSAKKLRFLDDLVEGGDRHAGRLRAGTTAIKALRDCPPPHARFLTPTPLLGYKICA
jgi:hypothetical protein